MNHFLTLKKQLTYFIEYTIVECTLFLQKILDTLSVYCTAIIWALFYMT